MCRCTGHRVATISATHTAGTRLVDDGAFTHQAGDRETARHCLGNGHQVWLHATVLDCKHLAGTTKTTLYFITDKNDTVLIADGSQRLHELDWCCIETAFTLDRLDNDRSHVFGFNIDLEKGLKTCQRIFNRGAMMRYRKRCMKYPGHRDTTAGLVRNNLAGQCTGQCSTTMKCTLECNDTLTTRSNAGNLNCIFDSLGAGGEEQ